MNINIKNEEFEVEKHQDTPSFNDKSMTRCSNHMLHSEKSHQKVRSISSMPAMKKSHNRLYKKIKIRTSSIGMLFLGYYKPIDYTNQGPVRLPKSIIVKNKRYGSTKASRNHPVINQKTIITIKNRSYKTPRRVRNKNVDLLPNAKRK